MKTTTIFACLFMLAGIREAGAAPQAGLAFTHHDWEIACDNTRTCRAAGYHSENGGDGNDDAGEALPVSVLLTRNAGPHTPVQGELQLGNPGDEQTTDKWPRVLSLTMRINARPVGKIVVHQGKWTRPLSPQQTAQLLAALTQNSRIEWSDGQRTWRLSDKGAAAVLLKMDAFQGRLGTPGALVRKGSRDENGVLPPLPLPVVEAAPVASDLPVTLPKASLKALRAVLGASMKDCAPPDPSEPDATDGAEMSVWRLSSAKLLASMTCWRGAYNEGAAYWVVNARPPYSPELVTHDASDYSMGKISASHKGRGIGDCWSFREWDWNGERFVHTSEGTTGQCKSIAPGGAWSLPVLVTQLRPATDARP